MKNKDYVTFAVGGKKGVLWAYWTIFSLILSNSPRSLRES